MADNSGILFYIQDVYYNCQFRYHENHHDVSNFFNKIPKGFITRSFVVWVYLQHISDCNFFFKSLSSGDMSLMYPAFPDNRIVFLWKLKVWFLVKISNSFLFSGFSPLVFIFRNFNTFTYIQKEQITIIHLWFYFCVDVEVSARFI